jgi:hypothetical protein
MIMSTSDPFLTIFTAPKPFTNPHINLIQRNAIQSWQHLGDAVRVLLVGNETGISEFADEVGIQQLPDVACNEYGTPLVSSIFQLARQNSTSPLLAYVNADILLLPGFVELARQVFDQSKEFLIVGQRWDLAIKQDLDFNLEWDARLLFDVKTRGRRHPPGGSDFFIFPRECFTDLPKFAIGRAGWDNWMFYHSRVKHWPVVDVSSSLNVIHQDHDYSHLPGGQPHYQMPESFENIRLAGGRRAIFNLMDADYTFHEGKLVRIPLRGRRIWRSIETYPLIKWQSYPLAELTFTICHPFKAFGEWRGRLAYKINAYRHH